MELLGTVRKNLVGSIESERAAVLCMEGAAWAWAGLWDMDVASAGVGTTPGRQLNLPSEGVLCQER